MLEGGLRFPYPLLLRLLFNIHIVIRIKQLACLIFGVVIRAQRKKFLQIIVLKESSLPGINENLVLIQYGGLVV